MAEELQSAGWRPQTTRAGQSVIDATTGEFVNAESNAPALESEKVDATGMNNLFTALNASTSVAELDEIFLRAENTLSNEELDEANKAYQARKQSLVG